MQAIFCYNPTMTNNDDSKFNISEQDANLWNEFSAGVKRKKPTAKIEVKTPEAKIPTPQKKVAKPVPAMPVAAKPVVARPIPPLRIGQQGGVDSALFRKLKRGNIRIESRLDLHAMTREQAWRQVSQWIPQCRNNDKRCLLLVTGKGTGALQSSVPLFLNHIEIRSSVLCCLEAAPKDGGSGAFYIYLKRGS